MWHGKPAYLSENMSGIDIFIPIVLLVLHTVAFSYLQPILFAVYLKAELAANNGLFQAKGKAETHMRKVFVGDQQFLNLLFSQTIDDVCCSEKCHNNLSIIDHHLRILCIYDK